MDIREVCDLLDTTSNTVYRWVRSGHIPKPKKKRVLVTMYQDINDWPSDAIEQFKAKLEAKVGG